MIGTGMNPEGIDENEIMFEFMSENTWRTSARNITFMVRMLESLYGKVDYTL